MMEIRHVLCYLGCDYIHFILIYYVFRGKVNQSKAHVNICEYWIMC